MASNTTSLFPSLQAQKLVYTVTTSVCLPIAWIAVCLRFLSRHYSASRYGWDDWTIIIALISASVSSIIACVTIGSVTTVWNPATWASYGKSVIVEGPFYYLALCATKLSILFLYARIFPTERFRIAIWAVGAFVAAYSISAIIVSVIPCHPLEALWDPSISGTCIDIFAAFLACGVLNIVTDLAILMMPIPMIWNLHANWITKLQISALLFTGTLVTVISIARVIQTVHEDPTSTETDPVVWSIAEMSAAIVSACLPTYRPLFDKSKRRASHQYYSPDKRTTSFQSNGNGSEQPLRNIHVTTSISNTWTEEENPSC